MFVSYTPMHTHGSGFVSQKLGRAHLGPLARAHLGPLRLSPFGRIGPETYLGPGPCGGTNAFEFGTSINKVAMPGRCRDLVNLCACGCVLFRFESCKKLAVALGTHRFFCCEITRT